MLRLPNIGHAIVGFIAVPVLLVIGIAIALSPPYAAALVVGMGVAAAALVVPMPWLFVTAIFAAGVVGGSAEYFLGMGQANWLPYVLALVVAVRAALAAKLGARSTEHLNMQSGGYAAFVVPLFIYIFTVVAAAAANGIPVSQIFASIKNYLLMWGVLIALLYTPSYESISIALWRSMTAIAIIQLPAVIYQRFFIASKLSNSASSLSFDAINGTFGGGLQGGRSGALTMFICIIVGHMLILWRDRQIKAAQLLLMLGLLLPATFLVEVKAVVVWLPLVALLVFLSQIRNRPLLFIFGTLSSFLLAGAVLVVYRYSFYAPGVDSSLAGFFDQIAYVFDPDRFNPATGELGRVSALVHWFREIDSASVANWLVGYGPGASRSSSTVAVGEVAKRYPFYIDISAAAALLWDLGVMGTLAFVALLSLGAGEAWRLSRQAGLPKLLKIHLEAAAIGLVLILSSVFYIRDAIDGAFVPFLTCFFLSLVVYARRLVCSETGGASSAQRARRKFR